MAHNSVRLTLRDFHGKDSEWDDYRFHLNAILRSQGIRDLVDIAIEGNPIDPTDAEQRAMYQTYGLVVQSLKGAAMKVARSCPEDLVNLIKVLEQNYNAQTKTSRFKNLKDMLNTSWDQSKETVESFIAQKEAILNQKLKGIVTPEEIMALSILGNLPSQCTTLITPMLVQENPDIELCKRTVVAFSHNELNEEKENDVHSLMVASDKKKGDPSLKNLIQAAVNTAFKKGGGKAVRKPWEKTKPWEKKKPWQNKGAGKKGDKSASSERVCWNCGDSGHEKKDCPKKK